MKRPILSPWFRLPRTSASTIWKRFGDGPPTRRIDATNYGTTTAISNSSSRDRCPKRYMASMTNDTEKNHASSPATTSTSTAATSPRPPYSPPTSTHPAAASEWRKHQLQKLQDKFSTTTTSSSSGSNDSEPTQIVNCDEDLQPMWKEMESRVTRRRLKTKTEMGGRTGRMNQKRTDEDLWLQEGLYDHDEKER